MLRDDGGREGRERETHTHQLEQLAAAATDFTVMQIPTTDRS